MRGIIYEGNSPASGLGAGVCARGGPASKVPQRRASKRACDHLLLDIIRVAALLAVTLAYALFDVFNKRNVPNVFAYATVVAGVLITLTYGLHTIELSVLFAVIIAAIGYPTYKYGVLGGGDLFEFVFISLVMPMQLVPLLLSVPQFSLPFILSVFIATGYATMILAPAYYILKAKRKLGRVPIEGRNVLSAVVLLAAYAALIIVLNVVVDYSLTGTLILLLAAIPSALILVYKKAIYEGMTLSVYPSELESGDMIATNMMGARDLAYFRKRSRRFGRLATRALISEIKHARRKIPVYKNAVPLALFTFIGVVVTLLVGNLMLLILV